MRLSDKLILSLCWRLGCSDPGIQVLRAVRYVIPRLRPYTPVPKPFADGSANCLVPAEVRASSVPAAGLGLFARAPVKAGECIGEYLGDVIDSAWHWMRLRNKDYVMRTEDTTVFIDAAHRPEALMRYVNHHFDPARINVRRVAEGRRVYYFADKDIASGEEFFVSYGDLYWKLRGSSPSFAES
jgi:hypothetical protein